MIDPAIISLFIFMIFLIISLVPLIMYSTGTDFDFLGAKFVDFRQQNGGFCGADQTCYGPFGSGAVLLSLFLPLGLALALSFYFRVRSSKLIKLNDETKKLELEFSGSLFQLGNRIGDGIPMELAFSDVAENMRGTPTGNFFTLVARNIQNPNANLLLQEFSL